MYYYECWFKGTEELIAEGWSVGDDGLCDQTFFCKTEEPIRTIEDMKRHLSQFTPNGACSENLINCLRPNTVAILDRFDEIDDLEFTFGCGIPA